jgi:hypothetical protein
MQKEIENQEIEMEMLKDCKSIADLEAKAEGKKPRKKRVEGIRKPSKYEDGLPFDNIRYKYNRSYYEKNREKIIEKMKGQYHEKSKKLKLEKAIKLLVNEFKVE